MLSLKIESSANFENNAQECIVPEIACNCPIPSLSYDILLKNLGHSSIKIIRLCAELCSQSLEEACVLLYTVKPNERK